MIRTMSALAAIYTAVFVPWLSHTKSKLELLTEKLENFTLFQPSAFSPASMRSDQRCRKRLYEVADILDKQQRLILNLPKTRLETTDWLRGHPIEMIEDRIGLLKEN